MKDEDLDRKLSRLLAAVGAEAEPALLTRARARIESRARQPLLVRWAMRPAALGASMALLVASAGLSFALIAGAPRSGSSESATLLESLLEERGIEDAITVAAPAAPSGSAADSGGAR
ncbi:MAG TPA: hypothetical protein VGK89_04440 [Candidatus Eisenbacteria bacterium]|jgi:ribosomal protein L12E/L44/L45/RPP1/RPP2